MTKYVTRDSMQHANALNGFVQANEMQLTTTQRKCTNVIVIVQATSQRDATHYTTKQSIRGTLKYYVIIQQTTNKAFNVRISIFED